MKSDGNVARVFMNTTPAEVDVVLKGTIQGRGSFFSIKKVDATSRARLGSLNTSHGTAETPCFLPVASHGTLRAMTFEEAAICGTQIVMANAWHVYREAGPHLLKKVGGAHGLMKWDGTLFTDSGGYQIFSLRETAEILDQGVSFKSATELLTPEYVVEIQKRLGSDVMIVLDDCPPYPSSKKRVWDSVRRTTLWARTSMKAHMQIPAYYGYDQELWGIIQGGAYKDLRKTSVEEIAQLGFGGYGIGGLSIGMPKSTIREMTVLTCELLPSNKPRHLLGVGLPTQILEGVEDGVDTFDCVLPIRKGQRGLAYTRSGPVRYKDPQRADLAELPLDLECKCQTCQSYSRGRLSQLYREDKIHTGHLAAIHNITFFHDVLRAAREAIRNDRFLAYKNDFILNWETGACQ